LPLKWYKAIDKTYSQKNIAKFPKDTMVTVPANKNTFIAMKQRFLLVILIELMTECYQEKWLRL
jgi:hypothetical protein